MDLVIKTLKEPKSLVQDGTNNINRQCSCAIEILLDPLPRTNGMMADIIHTTHIHLTSNFNPDDEHGISAQFIV
jgi:hypothetical protein